MQSQRSPGWFKFDVVVHLDDVLCLPEIQKRVAPSGHVYIEKKLSRRMLQCECIMGRGRVFLYVRGILSKDDGNEA